MTNPPDGLSPSISSRRMVNAFIFHGCPPGVGSGPAPGPAPGSLSLSPIPASRRRAMASSCPTPAAAFISLPAELRLQLRFLLHAVRLVGSRHLPDAVVSDALRDLLGKRVTRANVWRALRAAEDWLSENGYVASRVAVAAWPARANGHVLVVACVEAILTRVRLQALTADDQVDPLTKVRTTERTICRALGIKVGEVFRWRPNSFQRLMQLGVFEFARAELEPIGLHEVGVIVSVRERSSTRIEPGAGITSDGGAYGDVSIMDANFLGRAQRLRFEWQRPIGASRSAGGLEFEDPRVGATVPVSYRVRAYRQANPARNRSAGEADGAVPSDGKTDRDGIMMDFSWTPVLGSPFVLSAGPILEHIHPLHGYANEDDPENQAMLLFSARHVSSEQSPLPRFGSRMMAEYGTGFTFGFGRRLQNFTTNSSLFHRVSARISHYLPFGSRGSFAMGLNVGCGSQNLPYHEKAPLGGPRTVRGYSHGELGLSSSFVTGRFEVRIPLVIPQNEEDSDAEDATAKGLGSTAKEPPKETVQNFVITKDSMEDGKVKHIFSEGDVPGEGKKFQLPKLPHLAGVVFLDVASADVIQSKGSGRSFGLGLRIGNVLTVEYAVSQCGRPPRLHFGMVDRDL